MHLKKRILSLITIVLVTFLCMFRVSVQNFEVCASDYDYLHQVAAFTNHERAGKGISLLAYSDELSRVANVRAKEIASYFSHTRPDGREYYTVMEDFGIKYSYYGENIAFGPSTPQTVVAAWMDSSPHRANILKSNYKYIGVGMASSNGTYYWVQLFASSRSLSGTVVTFEGETYNTTSSKATASTNSTTSSTAASDSVGTATTAATATSSQANVTSLTNSSTIKEYDSSSGEQHVGKGFLDRIIEFFKWLFGFK